MSQTFLSPFRPLLFTVAASAALSGLVLLCLSSGCGSSPASNDSFGEATNIGTTQDHFSLAMNFFERYDEFEPIQARKQVLDNLNRWAEDQPADKAWRPDPLTARVPEPYRDLLSQRELERMEFNPDDMNHLNEAAWSRDLVKWVSGEPLDPFLAQRLPGADDGLSKAEIDRLASAMRLFDWTIRNIQLDALLPTPKGASAGPSADPTKPNQRPPPPPFQAVPGPGYRHFPWQTLMMGHGDAWQRARVFLSLCRQDGIDAVMLGFIEGAPNAPPRPWLPAVFIKDRLYLFDTGLGLPIPGAGKKGVATLEQVKHDPKLLRQLDLDAEHPYGVTAEALTQTVVLIDASLAALSRRMALAEARLSGDNRMVLSVAPTQLKERVGGLPGVSGVQIWLVPFETLAYRVNLGQRILFDKQAQQAFFREEGPFQTKSPLVLGRHQHFRGIFDPADQRERDRVDDPTAQDSGRERASARTLYLASRIPDDEIDQFESSEKYRKRVGLVRQPAETPEAWQERLRSTADGIRNTRHTAACWLGITHYERQSYAAAIDWFQRRTLDVAPDALCAAGARYNLARAHEALGDFPAARELYYGDESPQRHGNRLRAEWLDSSTLKKPKSP